MAVDANSTIISVVGGGTVDKKDIAVMAANGGIAVYETDKNIYVNAVKEEFINQRVINEYGGPVTQILQNVTPYAPGGTAVGQIQFLQTGGTSGVRFDATNELKFDIANSKLTVFGDIVSSIGNVSLINGQLSANSIVASANLSVTDNTTLSKLTVTGTANFDNTVNIGNSATNRDLIVSGTANAIDAKISNSLTVTGNANLGNTLGGNLVTANYFYGVLEANSNAQPNVTSVANTLAIGNLSILGNTNTVSLEAADVNTLILSTSNSVAVANYDFKLTSSGVLELPQSTSTISNGNAILSETTGNGITINTSGAQYHFGSTGNLTIPTLIATSINGTLASNSNAQPNVTSLGNLTGLQVGKTGDVGNIDVVGNVNITNTLLANTIGNAASNIFGNVANFDTLTVMANVEFKDYLKSKDIIANGNVTINGNLYVQGNTNYVDVENLNVKDPIISLGGSDDGGNATTDGDRGIWLRGVTDKFMGWYNGNAQFVVASNASVTANTVTVNDLGDIVANNFIGKILGDTTGNLLNGNSNVSIAANGNVMISSAGNANILVVTDTGANITGTLNVSNTSTLSNVTANIITANGFTGDLVNGNSQVSVAANGNITVTSTSVATLLVTSTGANITGTANISGNVIAPNFVGTLASGNSKIAITANGNITMTSGGNLMANVSNTVFAVNGNLTAGNITGVANVVATNFNGALSNGVSSVTINGANGEVVITTNGIIVGSVFEDRIEVTGNLNVSDTMTTGNFTVANAFTIGNAITTPETTFGLVNANVTTLNMAGAATTINIGATTGTLTVNNPTVVGSQTTQNLFNTVATTLNIGGAATTLSLGATSGNTVINNVLQVNGGDITSNVTGNFNIITSNAANVNIGSGTSNVMIGDKLMVTANLTAANAALGNLVTANWTSITHTANVANLNANGKVDISNVGNLFIGTTTGAPTAGQYLQANAANGQAIWGDVDWIDLATSDATRGPSNIALGQGAEAATDVVAIGVNAGKGGGGTVLIGKNAGANALPSGSIEINGTGTAVAPNSSIATKGLYINPIRTISNTEAGTATYQASLRYDTTTNEVVWTTAGAATAATAGTVTTAAQGNITSLGTLTGLGVNGTITAGDITANTGVFTGNGSGLSAITGANVTGSVPNADAANAVAGANVTGQVTFAGTANSVAAGNISGTTLAAGVTGSSLTSVGTLTSLGVSGTITAANITANTGTFTGNGAGLSSVNIANVANALVFSAGTNNGIAVDAANVGTIDITINGTTYTLYAVPKV